MNKLFFFFLVAVSAAGLLFLLNTINLGGYGVQIAIVIGIALTAIVGFYTYKEIQLRKAIDTLQNLVDNGMDIQEIESAFNSLWGYAEEEAKGVKTRASRGDPIDSKAVREAKERWIEGNTRIQMEKFGRTPERAKANAILYVNKSVNEIFKRHDTNAEALKMLITRADVYK